MSTDSALLSAFGFAETAPGEISPNGLHLSGILTCANCGTAVEAKHHVPGTRAWCKAAECQRAATAQRVREFRQRRKQI